MTALKKILIVDDLELNRKILTHILEGEYVILCAENGRKALDILRRETLDISAVLLDIIMPVMDGYEVLRELSHDAILSDIPVLVTSQGDGEESELKVLNLGASDFVSKPYNPNIIRRRLRNLIRMHEATRAVNILECDVLTHLYNKETFCHRVSEQLSYINEGEYAIVQLDIASFNYVNDSYGIIEANNLLKYIADRLQLIATEYKGLCARIYADKFLLFVKMRDHFIQDISQILRRELDRYSLEMNIHVFYGVYAITDKSVSVNVMCDRAAVALDIIKGSFDREYMFYDDSIRDQRQLEQRITSDMENALKEGQFCIYFQPKYGLLDGKISGAEALVRWNHPQMGFMSPGIFIPIFEKNGFISELDKFVWDQTCKWIAQWKKNGEDRQVPVSVNVSRKDLYKYDLPVLLTDMVKRYGILPQELHLEITESAYTENPEQIIKVVKRLREEGFAIEMDDFGSGYSSFNMLSELPIDILKLDMKFIQNSSDEQKTRRIMGAIIDLAHNISIDVIAEGVELADQVAMLKEIDCNYVQGYYFAKPMPAEEFEKYLNNKR